MPSSEPFAALNRPPLPFLRREVRDEDRSSPENNRATKTPMPPVAMSILHDDADPGKPRSKR